MTLNNNPITKIYNAAKIPAAQLMFKQQSLLKNVISVLLQYKRTGENCIYSTQKQTHVNEIIMFSWLFDSYFQKQSSLLLEYFTIGCVLDKRHCTFNINSVYISRLEGNSEAHCSRLQLLLYALLGSKLFKIDRFTLLCFFSLKLSGNGWTWVFILNTLSVLRVNKEVLDDIYLVIHALSAIYRGVNRE